MKLRLILAVVLMLASCLAQQDASHKTPPLEQQLAAAQANDDYRYGYDLYQKGKQLDALPWAKKAYEALPDNAYTLEMYGYLLGARGRLNSDPAARELEIKLGYELISKSRALGNDSQLSGIMMELLAPGTEHNGFSDSNEVESALKQGEQFFAQAEYPKALDSYMRAHLLDPKNYVAALFVGDTYFAEKQWGSAGEWYKTAIAIDPDIETAYRYWGDALVESGRWADARDRYIDSWICAPYSATARGSSMRWAKWKGLELRFPDLTSPNKITQTDSQHTTLSLAAMDDKADNGLSAWMGYDVAKLSWQTPEIRQQKFPDGKYKHTVQEELDAYQAVLDILNGMKPQQKKNLDPRLQMLVDIDRKGLLAAYVLIARPDNDIAQEFAAYRKDHRDKLRQFLDEYVFPAAD